MPFCSNCGADVAGKAFCGKCGTPAGTAPPAASAGAPVAAPMNAYVSAPSARQAASSGIKPIVWILGGIAGFILLVGFVVVSSGVFFAHRLARNPALTMAKLVTAGNPNVEVVSSDEGRNTVTFRDKQSGEVVTMNFDDIKKGKVVFKANGKEASVQASGDGANGSVVFNSPNGTLKIGEGTSAKIPDWVPVYPGVTPQTNFSMQGADADGGSYQFKTKDSSKDVVAFYEDKLKSAGFNITANVAGNVAATSGGMLAAEDKATKRSVMVTAGADNTNGGAEVNVIFGKSKK